MKSKDHSVDKGWGEKSQGFQTFGVRGREGREQREQPREEAKAAPAWKMDFNMNGTPLSHSVIKLENKKQQAEEENDDDEVFNNREEQQQESLADMFRKKKGKLMEKYEQQKERQKSVDVEAKATRSKEDILRLRKEMMKPNLIKKQKTEESNATEDQNQNTSNRDATPSQRDGYVSFNKKTGGKEPNPELLSRLAKGEKTKVC
jgi:hypothetical protein